MGTLVSPVEKIMNILNILKGRAPVLSPSIGTGSPSSGTGGLGMVELSPSEKREAATGLKVTIHPPAKSEKLYFEFGFVQPPFELRHRIIANSGKTFVTDAELKTLRDLQAVFDKIHDFKLAHTSEAARKIFKQQARDASAELAVGKTDSVANLDFAEKIELQNDFATKLNLAKQEQRKLSAQALPFIHEIARRIGAAALELHDQLEVQEREKYATWGLPFVPSKLLVTIGQFSWRSEELCAASPGSSPKLQLSHVGIEL